MKWRKCQLIAYLWSIKSLKPKAMNTYEITYHSEKLNYSEYFQVKKNGEDVAAYSSLEFAEKFVEEDKATIIMRTKKIEAYFRGVVKRVFFPLDGDKFAVMCQSYSGGNDVPILDILDFKADTKEDLMAQLIAFKKKHKLILEA
jgi:hypothetical protein